MRYDDRLRTVLAQRAEHSHDQAVRWRQLVELLARGGGSHGALFDQAIAQSGAMYSTPELKVRRHGEIPAETTGLAVAAASSAPLVRELRALGLTPAEDEIVLPHENTMAGPVSDRLAEPLATSLGARTDDTVEGIITSRDVDYFKVGPCAAAPSSTWSVRCAPMPGSAAISCRGMLMPPAHWKRSGRRGTHGG